MSRKAHGTAEQLTTNSLSEPRPAGLFQTDDEFVVNCSSAVLEQPSPRGLPSHSLGRRNIVLVQSTKLNTSPHDQRMRFYPLSEPQAIFGAGFRKIVGHKHFGLEWKTVRNLT